MGRDARFDMATGTQLVDIVEMVKAEIMVDLDSTIAPGGDDFLKKMVNNQQRWLALHYDFSDLNIRRDLNLVAGTRYYDFPTTANEQDFELSRSLVVECYWSNLWYTVEKGIQPVNYNLLNPELNQRLDPVIRWQKYRAPAGIPQIEVWPLPATATRLRLNGMMRLPALAGDTDTALLDDLLLAQWTGAKLLARMKQGDAQALLVEAQKTLSRLIASDNNASQVFSLAGNGRGGMRGRERGDRPMVGVNFTP